jgi:hypothetical protein
MAKRSDIERATDHLSAGDLAKLHEWLDEHKGRLPYERIEHRQAWPRRRARQARG